MIMKESMVQMKMINMMQSNTTPTLHLLTKLPNTTSPIYIFKWPFLWHLKVSGMKKDLLQQGHTNPTPKCTLCMYAQMVAQEVDGPSLQPSTWHQYTCLTPPKLNTKGLHVVRNLSFYWRGCRGGGFQCLLCRNRGFRFHGFLRGQMGNVGGGGVATFLRRRWRCG